MRIEPVEIYSDATNAAILRHPARRFPGLLVQGDTLHSMCVALDRACSKIQSQTDPDALEEFNNLRSSMWGYLSHYKSVLLEHGLPLPFSEMPRAERP